MIPTVDSSKKIFVINTGIFPFSSARSQVSNDELSHAIGLIYDCAVDPERWPVALEAMSRLIGGVFASIGLYDPSQRSIRLSKFWGESSNTASVVREYETRYAAMMPFHDYMPFAEIDEPKNTMMMMRGSGRYDFYETPFYKNWAEPAGFKDVVTTILFRSETRFCIFGIHTPVGTDFVGPRELEVGRLLAPHVKRTVLISDMLDIRALEANSVMSALDLLGSAVVLTNENAEIIHANTMAKVMLAADDPILGELGLLSVRNEVATRALRNAIKRAATAETTMGRVGIGIPVPFCDGRPAIAHVLPLAAPPVRDRLAPSAKAAVFISTADTAPPPVDAIAVLFELTPAEQKVLASVLVGRNQAETAVHLSIAESTVKTHLGHIFSKTLTRNQSELAKLAERLAGPSGNR